MISFLLACHPSPPLETEPCFEELPEENISRVHRVSCSGEITRDEIRRGDFILENSLQRFIIRETSSSLSDPMSIGGSLITGGTEDLIFELRPLQLETRAIYPVLSHSLEEASLSFYEGDTLQFSYRLPVDSSTLILEGFDEAILFPTPQISFFGSTLISSKKESGAQLIASQHEDLSGAILIENLQEIRFKHLETLYQEPESPWIELEREGDGVEIETNTETYFLPIHSGFVQGYIPEDSLRWRIIGKGCTTLEWTSIETPPEQPECGRTRLRAQSNTGEPLSIQVFSQEHTYLLPKEGAGFSISPQEDFLRIYAGPAYEQYTIPNMDTSLRLERTIPPILLLEPLLLAPPDPSQRTNAAQLLSSAAARGVNYTILAARNIVSPFETIAYPHWQNQINSANGLLIDGDSGWLLAWPWNAIPKSPANGALPTNLSPREQLNLADRMGRTSLGSLSWFSALQAETATEFPDFLYIETPQDLPSLYDILDKELPVRFMGPQNWLYNLDNKNHAHSLVNHELFAQNLCFGNGPFVSLHIEDERLHITAQRPSWMNVDRLVLIGENHTLLAEWSFIDTKLDIVTAIPESKWIAAAIQGANWAVHIIYQ